MDNTENILSEYQGKLWMRMGECNRCGECCLGWGAGPCPHLIKEDYNKFSCAIQDHKSEIEIVHGHDAMPKLCSPWPANPRDLDHIAFQNKCGYFFVPVLRILVACPTYQGKEYCAQKWIDAVKAFDYPKQAYSLLWVDNSTDPTFCERWASKVPIFRLELSEDPMRRLAISMEHIRQQFLAGPWDYWLNLEADVIPPPHLLKEMLRINREGQYDWLGFGYPCRQTGDPSIAAFGCTMFSRRIMERYNFADCPPETSADGWWWDRKIKWDPELRVMEGWGIVPLEHLNG